VTRATNGRGKSCGQGFSFGFFDEWISVPLREMAGMDDCGGNKCGLLMDAQIHKNN